MTPMLRSLEAAIPTSTCVSGRGVSSSSAAAAIASGAA